MKAFDLKQLRKESTPEEYSRIVSNTINDLIVDLRKEREKNRRLVAAVRKLTSPQPLSES